MTGSINDARGVLQRPDENLRAHPVSAKVGAPRNNGPELMQQITPAAPPLTGQLF